MAHTILRLPKVKYRTGLSRSSIYNRIADNTFPSPVKLGGQRAVGWLESEIEEWLAKQIESSRSKTNFKEKNCNKKVLGCL